MSAAAVAPRALHNHNDIPIFTADDDDNFTIADTVATSLSNYSVPMSRLSRHSVKIRQTSSFPSILGLYHAPIEEEESKTKTVTKKERKKNENKKRKETDWEALMIRRHQKEGIYDLFERTKRKQRKALERSSPQLTSRSIDKNKKKKKKREREITFDPRETTLRAIRIEAVAREQMDRYESYIKNLKKKVENQREQRKMEEEQLAEKLKRMELEQQKKKMIRKRPKQEYIHDTKHIKQDSKYSKMVKMEDSLKRKGVLKTRTDFDNFWNDFGKKSMAGTDIFHRDPLTEVPDAKQWMAQKHPQINKEENLDMYRSNKPKYTAKKGYPLPPIGIKKKKKKVKSKEEPIFNSERQEPELRKSYSY